jgi:hypothetical protein
LNRIKRTEKVLGMERKMHKRTKVVQEKNEWGRIGDAAARV